MTRRRAPQIASRKIPKQARSTGLVAAVLEAAVLVLAKEGARRFTTARVAEKAGVSVGSVYQYFPNKEAILFRLQSDEWQQTTELMRGILEDVRKPPLVRLRNVVHAFIRSECEESAVRGALSDAAPLYRDAPEAKEARASGRRSFASVSEEVLPDVAKPTRDMAVEMIKTTLAAVGKRFSMNPRTDAEIKAYAYAMTDMFSAYLHSLKSARDAQRRGSARSNARSSVRR